MLQIHDNIKQIRKQKGYTQEALSKKLKISLRAYSKIENGETNLSLNRINDIASVLNVDIKELFDFEIKKSDNFIQENFDFPLALNEDDDKTKLIKYYQDIIKLLKDHNDSLKRMLELR